VKSGDSDMDIDEELSGLKEEFEAVKKAKPIDKYIQEYIKALEKPVIEHKPMDIDENTKKEKRFG
jgi:hypothetical protein